MQIDPNPPDPASVVLTFLESVGRRSEAELYLRLFREGPKESFAIIATEASVLRYAKASVLDALTFLHDLGLFAPVVIGLTSPVSSERAARTLFNAAQSLDPVLHAGNTPGLPDLLRDALRADRLPIVHLSTLASESVGGRYRWLGDLVAALRSRKVVVLRRRGGLGPHGGSVLDLGSGHTLATHRNGIGIVNATTDLAPLLGGKVLSPDERELLERLGELVRRSDVAAAISVTSPLAMLQELFTQKGAGTLIKRGSVIHRHTSYESVDLPRLGSLLTATFGAPLESRFFDRPIEDLFVEEHYRGAAIIEPSAIASYLTKFAVEPIAQGEGMGRDLWQAMLRHHSALFWRAHIENPAANWYSSLADGTMKCGAWRVYWRGVAPSDVPHLIEDAIGRPVDLIRGDLGAPT
jgi:GNAT superfamily N-acetyltransferase